MARTPRPSPRFTPYCRGVTRQQIVAFLNLTDKITVTERGHLTMRELQAAAVKLQQGKDGSMSLLTKRKPDKMTQVLAFHPPEIDASTSRRLHRHVPIIEPPKHTDNPLDGQLSEESDGRSLTPESLEQELSATPKQSVSSSSDGYDEEVAAESQDQIHFSSDSSHEA